MADPAKLEQWLDALVDWERDWHSEVLRWIIHRSGVGEGCEILDFSVDSAIFGQLLAARVKDHLLRDKTILLVANKELSYLKRRERIVAAVRTVDQPLIHPIKTKPGEAVNLDKANIDITGESYDHLADLGKFDLIILKEMLYGLKDLSAFFQGLKGCLKSEEDSRIFILTRPKNPPVPIPDEAMAVWRQLAPGRDEIITAAYKAGFKHDTYGVSCPIRVDKWQWGCILYSRAIPAVRFCKKATDKVIRDFIDTRQAKLVFEEKILALVIFQGDKKVEEHELVANRDEVQ